MIDVALTNAPRANAEHGGRGGSSESAVVSVCMATFKRNERLRLVLDDLSQQDRLPNQIVIVDNDPGGGAKSVVDEFRQTHAHIRVDFDAQPVPNIAITRNRSVQLAVGDWIAFIDDDERAPNSWLGKLLKAADRFEADGVLAPVEPQIPSHAPQWIMRGRFYDFPHQAEGAAVPLNCMRFGNVLLRADRLRGEVGPFDPNFGLMAGEDVDLLVRLARKGAKVIWSETAPVFEPVELDRLSLNYLARRAFSGGQGFSRYTLKGGYRPISSTSRVLFLIQAFLKLFIASILAFLVMPLGRHRAIRWYLKACANLGKLSVLSRASFSMYGRTV